METVLRGAVAAAIITSSGNSLFWILHNTQYVRRQPLILSVITLVSYQELIARCMVLSREDNYVVCFRGVVWQEIERRGARRRGLWHTSYRRAAGRQRQPTTLSCRIESPTLTAERALHH